MFDVLVRGGRIYDGTGNPWTRTDVGISDGRIVCVGRLREAAARTEVDASGLAVAPGFIDTHVHSDLLCTKPEVHKAKVLQGVTTELAGQDGISVAPVSEETKPLWQKQLKSLNGDIGDWPWDSIDEYLSFLEHSELAGNIAYLVPHGAVRTLVMGFEGREASKKEASRMRELVERGMEEGAFGVSTGLIYPPNIFSGADELVEICKGAAAYDGCFVVHIRNESARCLEALDEVVDIARRSGVRLHVSHFKVAGQANRDKLAAALQRMEAARESGVEVSFDQYPYTAGSTVFHSILPPWVHSGGIEEMLSRLEEPETRERIKEELASRDDYENWVLGCGWENIVVASTSSPKNAGAEGKTVVEIAKERDREPADAAFDLLVEERAGVGMVVHWGDEEDVMHGMRHPLQMVGSDGIFGGKPHPRLFGTFPRVLGSYARDAGALTMQQALRQMTGAPAQLLRLKDRGLIREGYRADLVVFDPDTVADRASYEEPERKPSGINHVLVNGELAVKDQQFTATTAGSVLRRVG